MEIAVISGKGGTGKSGISAAFATLEGRVVIADCDVDAANLYLLFNPQNKTEEVFISGHKAHIDYTLCSSCGICASYCRFDAIETNNGRVTISDTSCDGCFLCSRVCPENAIKMLPEDRSRLYAGKFRYGTIVYGRLAPGEENSGKLVNIVRDRARKESENEGCEITILDGPPGIGCPVISTITGVDKVVIVTEPTISGLSDLKRAATIVTKSGKNPVIIINKSDLNQEMSDIIEKWCNDNNMKVAGRIPFNKSMVEAMVAGMSIAEYEPGGEITGLLKSIWNNLKQ